MPSKYKYPDKIKTVTVLKKSKLKMDYRFKIGSPFFYKNNILNVSRETFKIERVLQNMI